MCNIKYGMNLRYANMWDMPLRFLAFGQIVACFGCLARYRTLLILSALLPSAHSSCDNILSSVSNIRSTNWSRKVCFAPCTSSSRAKRDFIGDATQDLGS